MDLTKTNPPEHIIVRGRTYRVKTWFKYWLRFLQICSDENESKGLDYLFIDEIPENKQEALKALYDFASPPVMLPRSLEKSCVKVLDYTIDANLLYAAFVQQYGIDLMSGYDLSGRELHWHKFLALIEGLKDTKLNSVIEIRSFDENDKTSYEESRIKLRDAWKLEGLTKEDSTVLEEFNKSFE